VRVDDSLRFSGTELQKLPVRHKAVYLLSCLCFAFVNNVSRAVFVLADYLRNFVCFPEEDTMENLKNVENGFDGTEYVLPPLPYDYSALEPYYDEETVRLHHDKHHAGYVAGLNAALKKLAEARASGDFAAIKHLSREVAFHGSGHLLHTLFWSNMKPGGGGKPTGKLLDAIEGSFGSFDAFIAQFKAATKAVEGSGWGVLAQEMASGKLFVLTAEKHQNLTTWGAKPILVCDVWEHAYYLKYKNDRGAFVDAFCEHLVNWDDVAKRLG